MDGLTARARAAMLPAAQRPTKAPLRQGAAHMRLDTAIEQFLTDCRLRGLAPATLESYRSDLHLLSSLARVSATDNVLAFTRSLVDQYFLALLNKGLAAATLHKRRASVSEFAKWCLIKRLVADNPMAAMPAIRRPRNRPRPLTTETRDRLWALPLTGAEAVIRGLLFQAGLRVSEVCALRVQDLDFGADDQHGALRVHGKGGKVRVVPMEPSLWHVLHDWTLSHSDLTHLASPVLARAGSRPYTRRMIERRTRQWGRRIAEAAARAGERAVSEDVTPHRFRHRFATDLLERGADLRQVQELLGHEDVSTTAVYTQVTAARLRSAVNLLARAPEPEQVPHSDSAPGGQAANEPSTGAR